MFAVSHTRLSKCAGSPQARVNAALAIPAEIDVIFSSLRGERIPRRCKEHRDFVAKRTGIEAVQIFDDRLCGCYHQIPKPRVKWLAKSSPREPREGTPIEPGDRPCTWEQPDGMEALQRSHARFGLSGLHRDLVIPILDYASAIISRAINEAPCLFLSEIAKVVAALSTPMCPKICRGPSLRRRSSNRDLEARAIAFESPRRANSLVTSPVEGIDRVVCGHTITPDKQIHVVENVWFIDTGAFLAEPDSRLTVLPLSELFKAGSVSRSKHGAGEKDRHGSH